MTAYRYTPSTPIEVVELLSAMFLRLPDHKLPIDDVDAGVDSAFKFLRECLGFIRSNLGDERFLRALEMSHEAEEMYNQGNVRSGGFRLKDIQALIRRR